MIIHTPMPLELVFAGSEDFKPTYEEISVRGCKVLVERTDATHASIVRILSTDPADFLNPALFPGAVITFKTG
ncbi:MAG TPA: YlzJ-like family protein [bacterium]|nr:YlzJ-like family protein [bacterium]